jgi:molybdopterin converting factor small subunit
MSSSSSSRLRVLLFGAARAGYGAGHVDLDFSSPAGSGSTGSATKITPDDVFKKLSALQVLAGGQQKEFQSALATASLAIDSEYVGWDENVSVESSSEIALIPAVSGG